MFLILKNSYLISRLRDMMFGTGGQRSLRLTASAIASVLAGHFDREPLNVRTNVGDLWIESDVKGENITSI